MKFLASVAKNFCFQAIWVYKNDLESTAVYLLWRTYKEKERGVRIKKGREDGPHPEHYQYETSSMTTLIFHLGSALFSRITAKVIHYLCFPDSFHFLTDWIYQMEATGLHTHTFTNTSTQAKAAHFKFYLHSLNGLCHSMVPELMFNFSSFPQLSHAHHCLH